jgi:hypothetical protein
MRLAIVECLQRHKIVAEIKRGNGGGISIDINWHAHNNIYRNNLVASLKKASDIGELEELLG